MKLENQIQIAAPPAEVWRIAVDVERWPEWTPTVTRVRRLDQGTFDVGSVALISQPGLPDAEWRVTALKQEESFSWETRVRGIRMVATHQLAPSGAGTLNTLRLEMAGFLAFLLWPLMRRPIAATLEKENAGLKAACEGVEAPDRP